MQRKDLEEPLLAVEEGGPSSSAATSEAAQARVRSATVFMPDYASAQETRPRSETAPSSAQLLSLRDNRVLFIVLSILGVGPVSENVTFLRRVLHPLLMFPLVIWSFIGWLIQLGFLFAGSKPVQIPGFLEQNVGAGLMTILSGLCLTAINIISYIACIVLFRYKLLADTSFARIEWGDSVLPEWWEKMRRRHQIGLVAVPIFYTLAGVVANRVASLVGPPDQDPFAQIGAGALVWDFAITIVSFLYQFGVTVSVVCVIGLVTSLHVAQVRTFEKQIDRNEFSGVDEIINKHVQLRHIIQDSGKRFNWYLTSIFVLWLMSFVMTTYQFFALLKDADGDAKVSSWRGFVYQAAFLFPLLFALWMSASLSDAHSSIDEKVSDAHILSTAPESDASSPRGTVRRRTVKHRSDSLLLESNTSNNQLILTLEEMNCIRKRAVAPALTWHQTLIKSQFLFITNTDLTTYLLKSPPAGLSVLTFSVTRERFLSILGLLLTVFLFIAEDIIRHKLGLD